MSATNVIAKNLPTKVASKMIQERLEREGVTDVRAVLSSGAGIALLPSGDAVVGNQREVDEVNLSNGTSSMLVPPAFGEVEGLAMDPSGKDLYLSDLFAMTITAVPLPLSSGFTPKTLHDFGPDGFPQSFVVGRDGNLLVAGGLAARNRSLTTTRRASSTSRAIDIRGRSRATGSSRSVSVRATQRSFPTTRSEAHPR